MNMLMLVNSYLAFVKNEKGQGLAEYALIIVLIAIAVVTALSSVGGEITSVFQNIQTSLAGTSN